MSQKTTDEWLEEYNDLDYKVWIDEEFTPSK